MKPVSSDLIQRLLGHAMVVLVLNRAGISVFRSLYDFAGRGFSRMMLWESARRECRIFAGLLPYTSLQHEGPVEYNHHLH